MSAARGWIPLGIALALVAISASGCAGATAPTAAPSRTGSPTPSLPDVSPTMSLSPTRAQAASPSPAPSNTVSPSPASSTPVPSTPTPSQATNVPSPSSTATPSPVEGSSKSIIEYRRSGGFAGLDDRLTITDDRKATVVRRRESFTLDLGEERYRQILRQIEDAEFSKLQEEYLPANRCCDLIEYRITYMGRTVRTMDTAVPESLGPVLQSLNRIIDRKE